MTILETDRLVLRQFQWEDLDDLSAILADPQVMRYVGNGKPKTRRQVQRLMEHWMADSAGGWDEATLSRLPPLRAAKQRGAELSLWATVEKRTGDLVGRCGLIAWALEQQLEVEVAYLIARKRWGEGLATEAARAVRDYGRERLGFARLISLVHPANVASQRVAMKIGMRHERDLLVASRPAMLWSVGAARASAAADAP